MCRIGFVAIPMALLFSYGVPAQAQERSAELQLLGFLVGEWTLETLDAGRVGTDVCEWLGTGFLTCETNITTESGSTLRLLSVFGYDREMERYTWLRYYSNGLIDDHIGWFDGEVWRWVQRDSAGGRFRMTIKVESPTRYSFTWDQSLQGKDWEPYEPFPEGTATKVR